MSTKRGFAIECVLIATKYPGKPRIYKLRTVTEGVYSLITRLPVYPRERRFELNSINTLFHDYKSSIHFAGLQMDE